MASVAKDGKGWRILFSAPDGRRKTIRLGRVDKKTAESIRVHVEALLAARISGLPVRQATATWLSTIGDALKERLARALLIESAAVAKLGPYLENYVSSRQGTCTAATRVVWRHTIRNLCECFGRDCRLAEITPEKADAFRQYLVGQGLASTTINKRLQFARMFFTHAQGLGLIPSNPFGFVKHRAGDPSGRRVYVSVEDTSRLIEHAPNVWWRLLIALARFGGLRIPSEAFSLRWSDVNWSESRIVVPSPKTANKGKPYRVIPMFPLLKPHLEEAWDATPPGTEYVFPEEYRRRAQGPAGWINCNLRTTFEKIIRRAGLEPWPRLWHNLRASCESDLAQSFPLAVVTKWLGNTPSIALRHYVDPTDATYKAAIQWTPVTVQNSRCGPKGLGDGQPLGGTESGTLLAQNPAQHVPASDCKMENSESESLFNYEVMQPLACRNLLLQNDLMEDRGFEPLTS
ncbi:tyrosine-type recombinase/integrase [Thermopirellula anaerolimosa]